MVFKSKNSCSPKEGGSFILEIKNLNLWTKDDGQQLLHNINLNIPEYSIVAIMGPSGSGKSSLLKAINRTNEHKYKKEGEIIYQGKNILNKKYSVEYLRTQIGTVLQKPTMFPMSIRNNVLFAIKANKLKSTEKQEILLEKSLREANLWEEVKDRLNSNPEEILSIGQKQRLCIARAIIIKPKILLMDEPTSALDYKASNKIENLLVNISKNKISSIVLISHSLTQIKKISNYTVFIKNGVIIEYGKTKDIFTKPKNKETKEFISDSN